MADNNPLDRSDAAARQRLIDANQIPATSPPAPPVDSTPAPPATTVQEAAAPVQKVGNTPMPDNSVFSTENLPLTTRESAEKTGIKGAAQDMIALPYKAVGETVGQGVAAAQTAIESPEFQKLWGGTDALKNEPTPPTTPPAAVAPPKEAPAATTTTAPAAATTAAAETPAKAVVGAPSMKQMDNITTSQPVFKGTDAAGNVSYSDRQIAAKPQSAEKRAEMERVYASNPEFAKTDMYASGNSGNSDMAAIQAARQGTSSGNSIAATPSPATVAQAAPTTNAATSSPVVTAQPKAAQPNSTGGTVSTISSDNQDTSRTINNGRDYKPAAYTPPQPEQTAQVGAMPQQPAYNQPKFKSNVLPDRFANEQMQSNIALANSAIQEGIADPSNAKARNAGKFGERYLKQLQDYDIQGNIAPQLKQQENAQQDLNQRRSGTVDSWKTMLANENANKSLSQRGQEESARLGQQASQFGQTNDLAQKRLAIESQPQQEKYITVDKYDDQGNKIGQDLRGQTTGLSPEDKQAQQNRASQAKKAIDQQIAEARKTGDNQKLIELANKRQALG
jgi:hypothetical protein